MYRLFYDTVKGGDYRAREANVYRLAEVSNNIIDQCVAQGVPFAREYGGLLANRSFGGAQVSRTFYAKGQTGQQLLLGAYSSLNRQIHTGKVKSYNRYEMHDLVLIKDKDGVERARGIIAKNLVTGKFERFAAHAVVIATGGYGKPHLPLTNTLGGHTSVAPGGCPQGGCFSTPPSLWDPPPRLPPPPLPARSPPQGPPHRRFCLGFTRQYLRADHTELLKLHSAVILYRKHNRKRRRYQTYSQDQPK